MARLFSRFFQRYEPSSESWEYLGDDYSLVIERGAAAVFSVPDSALNCDFAKEKRRRKNN